MPTLIKIMTMCTKSKAPVWVFKAMLIIAAGAVIVWVTRDLAAAIGRDRVAAQNQSYAIRCAGYKEGWTAGREAGYKAAVIDLYYHASPEWIMDPTITHQAAVLWKNEGQFPFSDNK